MNIDPASEKQIREFLLGRLPPQQSEEIEEQLLDGDELEELVRLVEHEIIDEYVDGPLNRRDRAAIENHFLQPPARQSKLAFAQMLRARLRRPVLPTPVYLRFQVLFAGVSAAWILAGLLSIVSVGSGLYITSLIRERQSLREQLRNAQTELAGLRGNAPSGQLQARLVVNFAVGGYKSASPGAIFEIPKNTNLIEAHIPLFDGPFPAKSYTVKIQNEEGTQIASEPNLEPRTHDGGSELIVNIDPKRMSPGTWTALVTPNRKGALPENFYCSVR